MQKVCLDFEWQYKSSLDVAASMGVVPVDCTSIDLPFCAKTPQAFFYRQLKIDNFDQKTIVSLELCGVQGVATVFLNGHRVGTFSGEYEFLDISKYINNQYNVLMLDITNLHGVAGIAGGVNLATVNSAVYIQNNGLAVVTKFCSSNFANINISVDLDLNTKGLLDYDPIKKLVAKPIQAELLVEVFGPRGKRATKKLKKLKLKKASTVEFVGIKVNKPHLYSHETPVLYSIKATLFLDGVAVSEFDTSFGIRTFGVRKKKFAINNRLIWLNGLKLDWQNGVMGAVSTPLLEQKKLAKVKDLGFNAIQVKGLPSNAFLDACDNVGVFCMVELVDGFFGDKPYDAFIFEREHEIILCNFVKMLRNHPSVVIYSIADCNPYTYGRYPGIQFARDIISIIRANDKTRPITGAVTELLPTVQEISAYSSFGYRSIKQNDIVPLAKSISKDKDIFKLATQEFCNLLDFVSYSNLSHRYLQDLEYFDDRQILGVGTPSDKMDELDIDELKYQNNILGDFSDGKDFDIMGNAKPTCVYRQILDGAKNKSAIATYEPDSADPRVSQGQESWDYPTAYGEKIVVDVFTSGDVVALYLDDEIVGRQLAGRAFKRKTRFEVDYRPGVLKAVSYFKGNQHCVEQLASVGFPKAVSFEPDKKTLNLYDKRDLLVVDIRIVDDKSQTVSFANREVIVTVSPECEIVAYGNANPDYVSVSPFNGEYTVPVYDGKAQVVLRAISEGKASLIATSAGLKTARLKITIKKALPKPKSVPSRISSQVKINIS